MRRNEFSRSNRSRNGPRKNVLNHHLPLMTRGSRWKPSNIFVQRTGAIGSKSGWHSKHHRIRCKTHMSCGSSGVPGHLHSEMRRIAERRGHLSKEGGVRSALSSTRPSKTDTKRDARNPQGHVHNHHPKSRGPVNPAK